MHLLVTDRLACPHCGPDFGLVLVADRLEKRRVLEGFFGCANCRGRYPVHDGFGDLRATPGGGMGAVGKAKSRSMGDTQDPPGRERVGDAEEEALLGALLGLSAGSGMILLTGRSVRHASGISRLGDGFEVLAVHPGPVATTELDGVSRIAIGARFPFQSGSLRGVVVEGRSGVASLEEGRRVLAPASRIVLLDPPSEGRERMEQLGLGILAGDERAVVGALK